MEANLHCANHWDVVEGLRRCSRCGETFCGDCLVEIRGIPYCGRCKNETILDVRSGVSGTLDLASRGRRFAAVWIDGMVITLPFVILILIVGWKSFMGGPDPFIMRPLFILPTVVMFVYDGLMMSARGQTLGKIALNIKIVRPDGSDISTGQAWGRAVMRQVLTGCLVPFNYLPIFFTKERTCLHDMVAGTRVVNWG